MDHEREASQFRRLVELRNERDTTKKKAETAEREYREYEAELYDELEGSPISGSRRIDLGSPHGTIVFTPRETKYGRILDGAEARQWFADRDMLPEVSSPGWSKGKLNALVKEYLEQGKPMPPGVDWYASRGITISRKG